jgi:hypothetical protein
MDIQQRHYHQPDADYSSLLSDDFQHWCSDVSMILEGAKEDLFPFPRLFPEEDGNGTKAPGDGMDSPPIDDFPIEPTPVIVVPSRASADFAASIKEVQQSFTSVFQSIFPPTTPRRGTCLESTTSIGWFPNGTFVEGAFDPATFSFGDSLDLPSALSQVDPSAILGSALPAVASATAAYPQDMIFRSRSDSSIPDAMDISVASFSSDKELDHEPPAKISISSRTMSADTQSLKTCKNYCPSNLVCPSGRVDETHSNLRENLRKQESSSSMNSSAHESFASTTSDAYMSANEDGDSRVSAKRRIRWRDPATKKYVIPKKEDVLLGRGGRSNNHTGNKFYRKRILNEQRNYQALPNSEKGKFSRMIVDWVHKECSGRFLKKDEHGWFEVTLERAYSKVSQALREDHSVEGKKRKKYKVNRKTKQTGGKKKRNRRQK